MPQNQLEREDARRDSTTMNAADECVYFVADEPAEDPSITCWLNTNTDEDDEISYTCTPNNACLDYEDRMDHTEDSW
jgi:hypothetical protein